MPLKSLIRLVSGRPTPSVPLGRRVYAVGDIHGRRDLLDELLAAIEADDARRGDAETLIVFLGDLVDRGPDSRGVVERLLDYSRGPRETRFLMGNHEEVFLKALAGDVRTLKFFTRIGGRETILSYGVSEREYRELDFADLLASLIEKVPRAHVDFLSGFGKWVEMGDYLFVHAGIRPGIPLEAQEASDLAWIRDEFLTCRDDFGKVVVHGHSITGKVDVRPNRIGIDTGAFASGRLTALGLEGAQRWFLATGG